MEGIFLALSRPPWLSSPSLVQVDGRFERPRGFTGKASAKNQQQSGNDTTRDVTTDLSEEGDEDTFAHVTPVASGEESVNERVVETGQTR